MKPEPQVTITKELTWEAVWSGASDKGDFVLISVFIYCCKLNRITISDRQLSQIKIKLL